MKYAEGHAPNARIVPRIPELTSDLAYAAGIVDGEGCITARVFVNKYGFNQTTLVLQVCMCSHSVISWLVDRFGGRIMKRKAKGRWRIRYTWRMRGHRVGPILKAITPFMIEKREQALLAIQISDCLAKMEVGGGRKVSDLSRRSELATAITRLNNPIETRVQ
jgi:hypothetical protein